MPGIRPDFKRPRFVQFICFIRRILQYHLPYTKFKADLPVQYITLLKTGGVQKSIMMETGKVISVKNAEHYTWGKNSDGWHLLKNDDLSVIEELMRAGTSERLHLHKRAQQLFYILSGEAVFEIDRQLIDLGAGETVHVLPGTPHRVFNNGEADLRFIVISSPKSHGDRTDL